LRAITTVAELKVQPIAITATQIRRHGLIEEPMIPRPAVNP